MADDAIIALMSNRESFIAAYDAGQLPQLDFAGARLEFNFSGMKLRNANFEGCTLNGSSFENSNLDHCNFEKSDWANCCFSHATFNGCRLQNVRNAHKAVLLHTVHANGILMGFESSQRPWWNRYLDWERLKVLGNLPLFTASTAALAAIPFFFYVIDVYNHHVKAWKSAAASNNDDTVGHFVLDALTRLDVLSIPSHSLEILIAAILLFVASILFAFCCPPRVKQFSSEQWVHELEQSMLSYWPISWRFPFARIICGICYGVGGGLTIFLVSDKLWNTAVYIWRNVS